jgi:hypothetical protein
MANIDGRHMINVIPTGRHELYSKRGHPLRKVAAYRSQRGLRLLLRSVRANGAASLQPTQMPRSIKFLSCECHPLILVAAGTQCAALTGGRDSDHQQILGTEHSWACMRPSRICVRPLGYHSYYEGRSVGMEDVWNWKLELIWLF